MKKLLLTLSFIISVCSTFATVRNVPGTYATIQAALTACNAGDTVRVQPGTYAEHIVWPNTANIKLYSAGDTTNTTINGSHTGTVLTISHPVVDTNTVIKGFKITNGFVSGSSAYGGGVLINGCSPKFVAVSITGNHIAAANWGYGAGMNCNASSMIMSNSTISGNVTDSSTWGYGGGVYTTGTANMKFRNVKIYGNTVNSSSWNYGVGLYSTGTSILFTDCSVSANTAGPNSTWIYGTGLYIENANVTMVRTKVVGNTSGNGSSWYYGAGINMSNCTSVIVNSLVAENRLGTGGSFYNGAGIYDNHSGTGSGWMKMINTTVANNRKSDSTSISGSGIYLTTSDPDTIVNSILYNPSPGLEMSTTGGWLITYTDVRGGATGTGNINLAPGFVSWHNYHLTGTSPCIAAANLAAAPLNDLDLNPRPLPVSTNPDMGCYEYNCLPPVVVFNFVGGVGYYCLQAAGFPLTMGTPAGGTYTGLGCSGASFYPSVAGLGCHTISYTYTNASGCAASDTAIICITDCTGINTYDFTADVHVFPNPATDAITIENSKYEITSVRIVDLLGKEVTNTYEKVNKNQATIAVSHLIVGIYFVQITDETGNVINKKIVKE